MLPDSEAMARVMRSLELTVVVDTFLTDTARLASAAGLRALTASAAPRLEIDFAGEKPLRTGDQFGIGTTL